MQKHHPLRLQILRALHLVGFALALVASLSACRRTAPAASASKPVPSNPLAGKAPHHLDHAAFFKSAINSPQEVTRECLKCHTESATQVMHTAHWTWLSGDVTRDGELIRTGKKNLINNFCISVIGNWGSCTTCHAGYGWGDADFDFTKQENVDCLVCHDGSGTYSKKKLGLPDPALDLRAVAASVRRPQRDNCGTCHFNGGGGMGVKHGDLDDSLLNPGEELDVHMGRLNFQCVDCHKAEDHFIPGKVNATYSEATKTKLFDCTDCHTEQPHADHRINEHTSRIACQTCHVPAFARRFPTKMDWDWSQAGDSTRKDDPHEYLKIKGAFEYEENVTPEYAWYDGKMERYVMGDKLGAEHEHAINQPIGSRTDPKAKIWPFKVHRAQQVYDPVNNILLPPVTSGKDGYWTKFDWELAVRNGAEIAGLPYSGSYAFTHTRMYWPINHMVAPADKALTCVQCHSAESRLNWKELGYERDPVQGPGK